MGKQEVTRVQEYRFDEARGENVYTRGVKHEDTSVAVTVYGPFDTVSDRQKLAALAPLVDQFNSWAETNFHGGLVRSEYELIRAFLLWLAKGAPDATPRGNIPVQT